MTIDRNTSFRDQYIRNYVDPNSGEFVGRSSQTPIVRSAAPLPTTLEAVQREIRHIVDVSPRSRSRAANARLNQLIPLARKLGEARDRAAARSAKRPGSAPVIHRTAPKATAPAPPARSYRSPGERLDALVRAGVVEDTGHLSRDGLRNLALRDVERRSTLSPAAQDHLDGLIRSGDDPECDSALVARHIIVTGRPAYRSAWLQMLTGSPAFTPEERSAITDYHDYRAALDRHMAAEEARQFAARAAHGDSVTRAANEGTGSSGGFAVPYYLDPSLVVVAGGVETAQLLSVAKTVIVTTNNYHGWTAASTGFATDAEAAVSADAAPTFGGINVPLWAARDYLPYSIEFGMDQPGWSDNAVELFRNAYAEFVSSKTATGSGSSDVTGVFTAMVNVTTNPAHIAVTTAGSLAAVDVRAAWSALPERYRVDPSCAWLLSPSVEQQIAGLAASSVTNGLGPNDLTTDPGTGQRRLFGRPVLSVSDAPAWTGTSGAANVCVVGSFNRYVVASRLGGFTVELIPHVRDAATGRPTGQRAFLATARVGGDVIDANAFRLLANT